jgi:hypothetical protein
MREQRKSPEERAKAMRQPVLYRPGDEHITDVVDAATGMADFKGIPIKQCLDDNPGLGVWEMDDAKKQIEQVRKEMYCGEWETETKEDFQKAFEVLPVDGWRKIRGAEIFQETEPLSGTIHRFHVSFEDVCYTANRPGRTPYGDIVKEVETTHRKAGNMPVLEAFETLKEAGVMEDFVFCEQGCMAGVIEELVGVIDDLQRNRQAFTEEEYPQEDFEHQINAARVMLRAANAIERGENEDWTNELHPGIRM